MNDLQITVHAFTLDCRDPLELARFYAALLKWEIKVYNEDYACVYPSSGRKSCPRILFQRNPEYEPPVWPEKPGAQQQMAHLDFEVDDLEKAVEHALNCGAKLSDIQFSEEWKVLFDPAGHPFCLCRM